MTRVGWDEKLVDGTIGALQKRYIRMPRSDRERMNAGSPRI